MKLVKLSLVAALAVGYMGVLEANPLEDAIKNVDVSGALRYRFEQASPSKKGYGIEHTGAINETNTPHKFRAFVGTKIEAVDNFKVFGQLMYNNDGNGGWQKAGAIDTGKNEFGLTTKQKIVLKQAYLQYDLADTGVSVLFGKQELGTIWTDDFVGTAAKVIYNSNQGISAIAFAVDSFEGNNIERGEGDPDALPFDELGFYSNNMYGAALLANLNGLEAQVWGAYWQEIANLFALNLKYTQALGGGNNVGVKVTYLGNALDGYLKKVTSGDSMTNGNLLDARLFANFSGLDARVGGIFFGDKKKGTINTLEDITGPDLYIGREIFYSGNSDIRASMGQNVFAYVGVGYTLPGDVRVGVQGVFGQNTTNAGTEGAKDVKDTRIEGVFELGWKANKNLSFEGYYSYLNSNLKDGKYSKGSNGEDPTNSLGKHSVRLQALYKF